MDKATFIANVQHKIDRLNTKLNSMRQNAEKNQLYNEIMRERDDLQRDIDSLSSRMEDKWDDMKGRIEDGWNNLKNKFDDTIR